MLEKFAADYGKILYARPAEKDIHSDYSDNGVAPRLGILLRTLADSNNPTTAGLASHALITGDHSTLPILADHLDESGDAKEHPIREVDLRYAPRGIAIDKALDAEIARHRYGRTPLPLNPGSLKMEWLNKHRGTLSKMKALNSIKLAVPDAKLGEVVHSILRLSPNSLHYPNSSTPYWVSGYTPFSAIGELKPEMRAIQNNHAKRLNSTILDAHNYPDPRSSKKSKPPEQFGRGRKWLAAKIRKLRHEGRPEQQSIAIAENMAGNSKYAAEDAKTVVMNKVGKPIVYNTDDYHNAIIQEPEESRLAKAYATWLGVQGKPATQAIIAMHAAAHDNAGHVLGPANFPAASKNWRTLIRAHNDANENPVVEFAQRSEQRPSKVLRWATAPLTREHAANLLQGLHAEHGGEDAIGNGELVMDEAAKKLLGRGTENFAAAEVAKYAGSHSHADFHRALTENPREAFGAKVYADYLEENGMPGTASLLRDHADNTGNAVHVLDYPTGHDTYIGSSPGINNTAWVYLHKRSEADPSKTLIWRSSKLPRKDFASLVRQLYNEHGGDEAVKNGTMDILPSIEHALKENYSAAKYVAELYAIEHGEDEFHRAMHENPESATHILAYADWLREHGRDAHADLLQHYVEEHDKSKSKAHPTMQYSYMPEELTNWEPGTVRVHHVANPSLDHHTIEIRQRSLAIPNSTLRHIIFGRNGNITPLYKQLVAEGAEPAHAEPNSYHADFHIPANAAADVHGGIAAENYAAELYAAWRAPAGDIIEKVGNSGFGVVHKGGTFINNLEKFAARNKLRQRLRRKLTLKPKTIELPTWTPIG